jgi:hypothetical protein
MAATAEKCQHCNGKMVARGRFTACGSCGREPATASRATTENGQATPAPAAPRFSGVAAGSACRTKDCPGTLDEAGRCACCAKREAWSAAHIPARKCDICTGSVGGRGYRKYCKACAPLVARSQTVASRTETKPASKS